MKHAMDRGTSRTLRAAALLAGATLLAGCMYDPYTGTYYPCCTTPYPHYYYGYPGYAPYYGYPYQYPPPYYPSSAYPTRPYGSALAQRFADANVTHDGRLTLHQAQAAHWQEVVRNFPDIDVEHRGYVTLDELRVWLETHRPVTNGSRG